MKEQKKSAVKELNNVEARNFSDVELKIIVIKMLKKLCESYNSMEKDIIIITEEQSAIKNTISEMKSTLEGINRRLNEAENQISDLEDKLEKKHPIIIAKRENIFLKTKV